LVLDRASGRHDDGTEPELPRPWGCGAGAVARASPASLADDWPSYNKTLTSERYSPLDQINRKNVGQLTVLCTYDTKNYTSLESGLIMVNGALIGTTHSDIFSLDPATCAENWRTHEDVAPQVMSLNRGVAYTDGMLFRGAYDGRVLAYDFRTGKRIWRTPIADPDRSEFVTGAPIGWNGLIFIGNAGGDFKGVKGRVYALDAKTGKIIGILSRAEVRGRPDAWTARRFAAR
jgi:alcohol dehydrogenase (cytochrome c)